MNRQRNIPAKAVNPHICKLVQFIHKFHHFSEFIFHSVLFGLDSILTDMKLWRDASCRFWQEQDDTIPLLYIGKEAQSDIMMR